nr:DUF4132 domain-containing protein [uncultured Albidiferax sp.]
MGLLKNILNTIIGTPSQPGEPSAEQITLLTQALEPLNTAQKGLAASALDFVCHGTSETVLLSLAQVQSAEPGKLLGGPGRLTGKFNCWDNKKLEAVGEKSLQARAKFYRSISPTTPPLAALVRLGKLLAAADAGKSLQHPGAPVPDGLQTLFNDACFASENTYRDIDDLSTIRPAWTVALVAQLLAEDGLEPTLALQVAFERKGLSSYYQDRFSALSSPPAVADYMRSHPDAANALATQLSTVGRTVLAARLGADKALVRDFAPLLVRLAVDGSKTVRTEAGLHLENIAEAERVALLGALLTGGDTTQRSQAADWLARIPGAAPHAVLTQALASESSKPVQQAIRTALNRLDTASDASSQELPEPPAWAPFPDGQLGDEALALLQANLAELLEKSRVAAEAEAARNLTEKHKYKWAQETYQRYQSLTTADLQAALQSLQQPVAKPNKAQAKRQSDILASLENVLAHNHKLLQLPGFSALHLARWIGMGRYYHFFWNDGRFQQWLARQAPGSVDLRALDELLQRAQVSNGGFQTALSCLGSFWNYPSATQILPAHCIWPFFAAHPEYIDEGLGMVSVVREGRRQGFELAATLDTLALFPTVQARWLPRLMELALGDGKTYRPAAQKVLSQLPDIGKRITDSLAHSKSEVRVEAAQWLASLGNAAAVPALTQALAKESRETVRAALLTAIEALGQDITPHLSPALLLAEARKGLKAKLPAGLAWFPLAALPACQWLDGTPVEADIPRWWVVLACKLKEPGGNALLARYLGLLAPASRSALGACVLRQFIAQDTLNPSLDEANAHAQATAPARWQAYQQSYLRAKPEYQHYYESNYQKTQDQVYEECKREKLAEYLGSAIGEKGILALTAHTPGHEAVTLVQHYLRDHYPRRAQIEAMLEGLAVGGDPVVIQLLLGLSRRYRTASVQAKARTLVEAIAERNGWTQDQLADRTIPTAGLDEQGQLALPLGDRIFTLVLDAALKPELRNPEGKAVKALPEPRQNDDAAQAKDTKAQLNTSKKELKQVIELQTARLQEAMCTSRLWPQAEWAEYVHAHPIVGRLVQRLVWLEHAPDGTLRSSFRPTEDGSLLNTEDDEVTLQADSSLSLAHGSRVDAATARAWVQHFKDYKLSPLFAQMARSAPALELGGTEISDRQGWTSDTFTLRGTFTKLGYQRAAAEDGGFFYQYTKTYGSVGVRVVLEFSGNCLPEENVAAALKTLHFENSNAHRWSGEPLKLQDVPPVLLAEAYADYHAVAAVCAGFDADWEKKMPW